MFLAKSGNNLHLNGSKSIQDKIKTSLPFLNLTLGFNSYKYWLNFNDSRFKTSLYR